MNTKPFSIIIVLHCDSGNVSVTETAYTSKIVTLKRFAKKYQGELDLLSHLLFIKPFLGIHEQINL